jgi:hypothetical protein
MGKRTEIRDTKSIVLEILAKDPASRNSDNHLFVQVLNEIARDNGINVGSMSFAYVINNLKKLGFPQFETVRRTRQKAQAENPELKACYEVTDKREANEVIFREEMSS